MFDHQTLMPADRSRVIKKLNFRPTICKVLIIVCIVVCQFLQFEREREREREGPNCYILPSRSKLAAIRNCLAIHIAKRSFESLSARQTSRSPLEVQAGEQHVLSGIH